MNIDHYLRQVFRFSFFPKRERQALSEELKTHWEDVVLRFQYKGLSKEEAIQKAIKECGEPWDLRSQFTKNAFGLSSAWIVRLSVLFFILFMIFAITLPSVFVMSPSLMLWLFMATILLTTTRKRRDRIVILVAIIPFLLAYAQYYFLLAYYIHFRFEHLEPSIIPIGYFLRFVLPNGLSNDWMGYVFLPLIGLSLFAWTRNTWSAAIPLIYSIGFSLWTVLRYLVNLGLLKVMHPYVVTSMPILNFLYPEITLVLGIMYRLVALGLTLLLVRMIRQRWKSYFGERSVRHS